MKTVTFPNNRTRQFTYDVQGQVTQINDDNQLYGFGYDERGRLTEATDPYGRAINYQYDALGNRTQLKSAKQQVDFSFDELNRLSQVVAAVDNQAAQTSTYGYNAVGSRESMTNPNGTVVSYQYDLRNRLKTLVHKASVAANAAILLSLSYTVDASGLRTQIAETRPGATAQAQPITRTTDYQYDAVKRLKLENVNSVSGQFRQSAWTYDRVGNRLRDTSSGTVSKNINYSYDQNDRLISERSNSTGVVVTSSFDANGNLLEKKQGATTLASYRWDAENRMVGATIGAKVVSYSYDPSGIRRAQEEVSGAVRKRTEYLIDANQSYAQVLEEWTASGATSTALSDETLATSYVFGDDLISQTKTAVTSFYHYDGLGSTRLLTNQVAAVTDRYAYTAFGETDAAGTSGNNSGSTENNYLYTGEQKDLNLGFYYLRARYMDPGAGGFISQDSWMGNMQDPKSLNKYLYANGNVISNIDPSGYLAFDSVAAVTISATLNSIAVSAVALGTLAVTVGPIAALNNTPWRSNAIEGMKAKQCALNHSGPSICNARMPIIFFGEDVAEHRAVISSAFQLKASSPLLNWQSPKHSRNWLRRAGGLCSSITTPGQACDEYPYAASIQGGEPNKDHVQGWEIDTGQNSKAGSMHYNKLLKPCGLSTTPFTGSKHHYPAFDGQSLYAVVPLYGPATTVGRCANGKINY